RCPGRPGRPRRASGAAVRDAGALLRAAVRTARDPALVRGRPRAGGGRRGARGPPSRRGGGDLPVQPVLGARRLPYRVPRPAPPDAAARAAGGGGATPVPRLRDHRLPAAGGCVRPRDRRRRRGRLRRRAAGRARRVPRRLAPAPAAGRALPVRLHHPRRAPPLHVPQRAARARGPDRRRQPRAIRRGPPDAGGGADAHDPGPRRPRGARAPPLHGRRDAGPPRAAGVRRRGRDRSLRESRRAVPGRPAVVRRGRTPEMTGALARLGGVAADLGWGRALRVAAVWALRRRYLLLHVDLPTLRARVPAPPPMPPTMRVGFLTDAARPALQALDPAMTPPEVSRRLAEGQECLLGWWRDELVHYRWTVVGAAYLPYLGRRLAPPPGEVLVVEIGRASC